MDKDSLLSLDIGKELQITIDGISFPVQSRLVGIDSGKFIIIHPPSRFKDVKHKLYPGNKIIVRYLVRGEVVAFATSLIEIISQPSLLMFLKFPEKLIHQNIRSVKRAACLIPVMTRFEGHVYQGVINDISLKGCQCIIMMPPPPDAPAFEKNQPIELHFKFIGDRGEQTLSGIIKNFRHKKNRATIGVSFVHITDEFETTISEYIDLLKDFFSLTK